MYEDAEATAIRPPTADSETDVPIAAMDINLAQVYIT